jgi:hypothetical protein
VASSRFRRQLDLFEGYGALIAIVVIDGGFCHDAREDGRTIGVRVDGYPAGHARRRPEDEFVERGPRGGLSKRVCFAHAHFTSLLGSGHGRSLVLKGQIVRAQSIDRCFET